MTPRSARIDLVATVLGKVLDSANSNREMVIEKYTDRLLTALDALESGEMREMCEAAKAFERELRERGVSSNVELCVCALAYARSLTPPATDGEG